MRKTTTVLVLLLTLLITAPVSAKVRIVSSTTDLGSIAQLVGGDHVQVDVICRGAANPHFVQILPSYMLKVARADIYLRVGMDLDFWSNQIIDGSGNGKLVIVDCAQRIQRLQIPTMRVDPSMGDIHIQGNPHYWLNPENGVHIAEGIVEALVRVDPANADSYRRGLETFRQSIAAKMIEWHQRAEPLKGLEIIMYHNSWPYFAQVFGINVIGFVEPRPGIEPTPSHTAALIDLIKEREVKIIGKEPYFSDRAPNTIARQTGARVVSLPTSVGGVDGADDYFKLFDVLIDRLNEELQ